MRLVYLCLVIRNITRVNATATVQWLKIIHNWSRKHNPDSKVHGTNMGPTWVLSAPDGPHVGPMYLAIREFCMCAGYRQCRNGDGPADFDQITTKSWFIMATSRYNCATLNQNFVGIALNTAISVRLCPLCRGGSSGRLLKWAIGANLET